MINTKRGNNEYQRKAITIIFRNIERVRFMESIIWTTGSVDENNI